MADKTPVTLGARPTDLDEHNADMRRREEESLNKRPLTLDCLDPTVAKLHEDRKDIYEWQVEVKLFRPSLGKVQAHMDKFDENVVAQNEGDAWAFFCDKIGEYPSRRDSKPIFTRLKKRSLRADEG